MIQKFHFSLGLCIIFCLFQYAAHSIEFNIYINPFVQKNSNENTTFINLESGFGFLVAIINMTIYQKNYFQTNFWLLAKNNFTFPDLSKEKINFEKMEKGSGIQFNSYSLENNNNFDTSTIIFDKISNAVFASMKLVFNNTNIVNLNPSLQKNSYFMNFTQTELLFINQIIMHVNITENALFYCLNSNILIKNVTIINSWFHNGSCIFAVYDNQNFNLSFECNKFSIIDSIFGYSNAILFNLYGKYNINFNMILFYYNLCKISCKIISINKIYNEFSNDLLNLSNFMMISNFFDGKSNFLHIKNQMNKVTMCAIESNLNQIYFKNNVFRLSDIFLDQNPGDCIFASNFTYLTLKNNTFSDSHFIKLGFFKIYKLISKNNSFENSFLLFNVYAYNYDFVIQFPIDLLLTDCFFKNNIFTTQNLLNIQYNNSTQISNSTFIENPLGTFTLMVGIKIVLIENCNFINSYNKFQFSLINIQKINIVNCLFYNQLVFNKYLNETIAINTYRQIGGCISISLFKNLVVKGLKLKQLLAKNSNFFEIIRDGSQENDQKIEQFEMRDSIIISNNFSSLSYSVSIYNLMITQECLSPLIFFNNSFINNVLMSETPNQINNAICFLLMSLNAIAHLEKIYVMNKDFTNSYFQSSLIYLNVKEITMENCSFIGYEDDADPMQNYEKLNHIKLFATIIQINDCKFEKLGSENGGALFISTTGSTNENSTVMINNSKFYNNTADSGGALFFNEPEFFQKITIIFCSFIENFASDGSHLYLYFDQFDDQDLSYLNFSMISCFFVDHKDDSQDSEAIEFVYQGNLSLIISNSTFYAMNSKLYFEGNKEKEQTIVIENSKFLNCSFSEKDSFSDSITFLRISQYLSGIQIQKFKSNIFKSNVFCNISLDISDLNYIDLVSFILISNQDATTILLQNNTFSEFQILTDPAYFMSSKSYLGIISVIFGNYHDNNKLIIEKLLVRDSSLAELTKFNEKIYIMGFIGGAVFMINGRVNITNSGFYNLGFISGSCISALKSSVDIKSSLFIDNMALDSASVAYIQDGNFSLSYSKLIHNYAYLYEKMLKCFGEGSIQIYENYFETDDLLFYGIINFNYKSIFVYGCNETRTHIIGGIYNQDFECLKNNSNNFFLQKINIKLNDSLEIVKYYPDLNQFAIDFTQFQISQIVLPSELITLNVTKIGLNDSITSETILSRNIFNLSLDSLDEYVNTPFFLIGYYDRVSQINTNIKTRSQSHELSINQSFLIGIELRQCPTGSLYNLTNQNCTKCSSGTFSVNAFQKFCKSCPSFANCLDGFLQPKPTFWRSNQLSSKLYFCKSNPNNCLGGPYSQCIKGSSGPKCESCDYAAGFVRKLDFHCSKCDIGMLFDFIFAMIIFFGQIIFLFIYVYSWYNTIELTKINENNIEEDELIRHKKRLTIYVDVLSNYFQIIALISMLKTKKFPNFIYQFLDLAIPTAIIDTKYCLFLHIDRKNIVYVDLIYIILVPVFKLILFTIFWLILKKKNQRFKLNKNHYILGLICLYKFEVLGQAYELFSYLSCETIDGISYMTKDRSFLCDLNQTGSVYFIFFCTIMIPFTIIWIILIPFCIFFPLIKNSKSRSLENDRVLEKYGVLYIGYKRKFYYWEFFKLLTKILFILIVKFVLFDPAKIVLIIIVFCIYAFSLGQFKPYAHNHFNRVEIVASIVYISAFLLFIYGEYSILFGNIDNTYDSDDATITSYDYLFSVINYIINGIFVVYLLYKMFFAVKKKSIRYYQKAKSYLNKFEYF